MPGLPWGYSWPVEMVIGLPVVLVAASAIGSPGVSAAEPFSGSVLSARSDTPPVTPAAGAETLL
ncbi:hypothetical protein IV498_16580 [Paenarthrobacter sp. Z7-10]|nr:hypothetical protein [Paenarthrobacter sp. Z7-10]